MVSPTPSATFGVLAQLVERLNGIGMHRLTTVTNNACRAVVENAEAATHNLFLHRIFALLISRPRFLFHQPLALPSRTIETPFLKCYRGLNIGVRKPCKHHG